MIITWHTILREIEKKNEAEYEGELLAEYEGEINEVGTDGWKDGGSDLSGDDRLSP